MSPVRYHVFTFPFFTNVISSGYEEEAPEDYYRDDHYRDDDYSPSPPHASGGSFYPDNHHFAPPPGNGGFTQHANQSTAHLNGPPIPPYNPADYPNNHHGAQEPYGGYQAPRTGENVSSEKPRQSDPVSPLTPPTTYFPPPPTSPLPPDDHVHDRDGAS